MTYALPLAGSHRCACMQLLCNSHATAQTNFAPQQLGRKWNALIVHHSLTVQHACIRVLTWHGLPPKCECQYYDSAAYCCWALLLYHALSNPAYYKFAALAMQLHATCRTCVCCATLRTRLLQQPTLILHWEICRKIYQSAIALLSPFASLRHPAKTTR